MPKKFTGENSKAVVARQRKAEQENAKKAAIEKAKEDAYWADDDKHANRKMQRKEDRDKKKEEEQKRKQELKAAADAELEALAASSTAATAKKATQHEVRENIERLHRARERRLAEQQVQGASESKIVVADAGDDADLPENVNRLKIDGETASTVDEAIRILNDSSGDPAADRHPEKRVKAAYQAFEDRELPRLKQEKPNMRLSQLKQILRKEWQKSPENPLNVFAR